jgi:hypothetical protein
VYVFIFLRQSTVRVVDLAGIDQCLARGELAAVLAATSSNMHPMDVPASSELPEPDVVDQHLAAHRLVFGFQTTIAVSSQRFSEYVFT